jgi:hypothetical protein
MYVIKNIEARFGETTVTRGTEHVFWGMNISFHHNGTASIKMNDYIKKAIAAFGKDITQSGTPPAKEIFLRTMRAAVL